MNVLFQVFETQNSSFLPMVGALPPQTRSKQVYLSVAQNSGFSTSAHLYSASSINLPLHYPVSEFLSKSGTLWIIQLARKFQTISEEIPDD